MITGDLIKIVLTGGPCGGKTTAISRLMEWLNGLGYCVAVTPESATELINSGIKPEKFSDILFFQQILSRNIFLKEDLFALALQKMNSTNLKKPAIMLCDRGAPEIKAYIGEDKFKELLKRENLNLSKICEERYAKVIHLRTAADGALKFYTTENNLARDESPEEALALDKLTEESWHGHPSLSVVDNSTGFEGKMLKVQKIISNVLGIPSPTEFEKKFLLMTHDEDLGIPVPSVSVEIEQRYLDRDRERIRKRTRDGSSSYFHTFKDHGPGIERVKVDRIITKKEYYDLMRRKDPERGIVLKTRIHFAWENQYFELDHFHHNGMWILEVRTTDQNEDIKIPPFIPKYMDVTDNYIYYNYNIALQTVR